MDQQKNGERVQKRPLTWRMIGYLIGILLLGHSMGLVLYPYLTYPAIVAYVMGFIGILLIALTAPLLRKQ